jgi:ribosome-binding protein aMBF1 (putative translation factor)
MHSHRIECRTTDASVIAARPSGGLRTRKQSTEHLALGLAVRGLRGQQGLSQEELGYRADLHRNYVGAIERGEINPTFRVLLKLERGLGVPLAEIMELHNRIRVRRGER